ncbi:MULTISPECIES: MBL fold metallo-hydrolase [Streptomyces]|uniref:Glyoxylase-like metal-dependent hydrolase (Beta-lactamase superfamily II)/rhodanese-related sulfurtransferase n=1 Tax=Streptomyces nymphaeiformis TaxID=2663842 RepID=A0A7W7U9F6_9ACTN|nr:MBL fold metallo-hydrolase [Streptomyces nymphaeiformis]MBB4987309.1 glyoxylase-like metal-dependent hydrolase (beta-lactamase superfamily II)/rhodanese-related sulfurtransferase [Streptomyces nymphaeiformis]
MGFADDHLIPLVDRGLGNSAYLVDLGDGRALAVDAGRDLRALHTAARERGLTVAYAADTHLHADFLSGALQLRHDHGAAVLASAAGHRAFDHQGLADGDEVDLGGLTLRALATPGHTDEHLSFLLLDGDRELGVFTGGSLIVNSAARTDLLGPDRTEELARAQYHSLRRLTELPDETAVWPTHGAGSFCSAPPGKERTSTIGAQKRANPLLAAPDEDTFVRRLTAGLGTYPAYFDRLAEANRRGPAVLTGTPLLPELSAEQVRALTAAGGRVVDARPAVEYAAGHIPGSLSIALRSQFATWLGWLLPDTAPLVFVTGEGQDPGEIVWQAYKIGYERLAGRLAGGMPAWLADGNEQATTAFVSAERAGGRPYVDVRQESEFTAGHVPGALHVELGALDRAAADAPNGAVVACRHGERAMTGAGLLERAGRTGIAVLDGGPADYAAAHGQDLVRGPEDTRP